MPPPRESHIDATIDRDLITNQGMAIVERHWG